MKLLVDMNLSPRWTEVLRGLGIEALHWSSVGPGNAPDRALFDYAAKHDLIILTHNLDFAAILASGGGAKPSVVQLRGGDLRPEAAAASLAAALLQVATELAAGALVTIDARRTRLRVLPLDRA